MFKSNIRNYIHLTVFVITFFAFQLSFGQSHRVDVGVGSLVISVNSAFADGSQRVRYPQEYQVFETRNWDTIVMKGGGIIIAAKNFRAKAFYPDGFPVSGKPDKGWTAGDKLFPYYVVDATSKYNYDLKHTTVPVQEDHRKYWKYPRPTRIVGGNEITADPWTVYDVLKGNLPTEQVGISKCHTSMGVTVTERAYVFGNPDFDDFAIVEYVFKNTGETGSFYNDGSPIIYPDNTLEDCYVGIKFWPVLSEKNVVPNSSGWKEGTDDWVDYTYVEDGDTLRVMYGWDGDAGNEYQPADDEGDPLIFSSGIFLSPYYPGMAVLHADKSPDDPGNDMSQPCFSYVSFKGYQSDNTLTLGRTLSMENMYKIIANEDHLISPLDWDAWKSTQNEVWLRGTSFTTDQYNQIGTLAFGPYQFKNIGDSVRIMLCFTVGTISWEKAIDLGARWKSNDIARTEKNVFLRSGRDSLFMKVEKVKELFKKADGSYDFNVQTITEKIAKPPAWPDYLELGAVIGGCRVLWTPVEDAAAYRVYRRLKAEFSPETPTTEPPYVLAYQCGGEDPGGTVVYSATVDSTVWIDEKTVPARHYWYYVTAINKDGVESSHFITRTYPTPGDPLYGSVTPYEKPPTRLDSVYVVPNPYHTKALKLYDRREDILDFVGLPSACRIRIFTQSGDLIETINHKYQFPPSSTESWEMRTSMDQTIASGLYIYVLDQCRDHNNEPIEETKLGKFAVIR